MAKLRKNAPKSMDVVSFHREIDEIMNYNEKLFVAAVWYANNGFKIVPFKNGYPKGISQRDATASLDQIEAWWHPKYGECAGYAIAMAHGGDAGFCAIDLDVKDANGVQNLADLVSAYGDYHDGEGEDLQTLMATTPSGGRHLIFQYHPEIISNSEVSVAGIDTRGGLKSNPTHNGGITFVEPSKKKGDGGFYRWDEEVTEIREMPQWLVDVMNGRTPEIEKQGIVLQDEYVESAEGKHGEGRDRNIYIDLLRFVGIGYTEEQLWGLKPKILERMIPPDEKMVDAKIQSAISSEAFERAREEAKTTKQVNSLKLIKGDRGLIKCYENLDTILKSPLFEHEYGLIEYDDFTQNFTLNKEPLASVVDWSLGIQMWISKKFGLDYAKGDVRDRVEYNAFENPHINIARDYMLACLEENPDVKKDQLIEENFWGSGRRSGGKYFERLCTEVLDLSNDRLHPNYNDQLRIAYQSFIWFWLQGVAARACVPACKMEIVLNIFGDQGIGKSLFFRDLCPNPKWFSDSLGDAVVGGNNGNRDELMKLLSKIIVEMPELSPVKRGGKSADDRLKQFISSQVDNFRRPYGHDSIDHPRTCALAGTSNNRDVYRDATGNRRFVSIDHGRVPIKVGDLDRGVMAEIREGLWAEVIYSFQDGEMDKSPYELLISIPEPLRQAQQKVNQSHRFEEIGVNEVSDWIADKTRVTWNEILRFSMTVAGLRDAKEMQIINTVRNELSNDPNLIFKRRVTRYNRDGEKELVNCWVNMNLASEKTKKNGVPKHWSTYQIQLPSPRCDPRTGNDEVLPDDSEEYKPEY